MVKSLVSKLSSSSSISSSTSSQNEQQNAKNRNDPGRFFADGVQFKAKLIGILEVGEARGDRMCQEALQDLKMAIRAAGEHKQRITIHVTIDGLRLRDEKTSDSLYHHPVHKISFIAQDMTDSRAFGYIFGSPDSGHRFFGIKTDKAASQVVLAMRDLFQVVFELKKKEIELARQQIQSKTIHEHQPLTLSVKNVPTSDAASVLGGSGNIKINNLEGAKSLHIKEMSPESVADLVDLEQELSSIQRGITQMERITPSEPTPTGKNLTDEDPFGDSFTNFPTYNLLPPPESSRSRHSKPNKPPDTTTSSAPTTSSSTSISNILTSQSSKQSQINVSSHSSNNDSWLNDLDQNNIFDTSKVTPVVTGLSTAPVSVPSIISSSVTAAASVSVSNNRLTPPPPATSTNSSNGIGISNSPPTSTVGVAAPQSDESQKSGEDYLSTSTNTNKYSAPPNELLISSDNLVSNNNNNNTKTTITNNSVLLSISVTSANATHSSQYIDAFSDLDPLGTGRIRPYVDKKYFFQELKNPPKKVLKDLSGPETGFSAQFVSNSDESSEVLMEDLAAAVGEAEVFETTSDRQTSSLNIHSCTTKALNLNFTHNFAKADGHPTDPVMLPRDTDPFSPTRKKSDPFQDGDIFGKLDPFEFEFPSNSGSGLLPETKITTSNDDRQMTKKENMFNGPLQVKIPPETSWSDGGNSSQMQHQHRRVERQTSESPTAGSRNRPSVFKQNTVDVISSISSKKMPHLFGQKFSKRDSNSINMRRLQESDSLSENETAPEPPPRPDSVSHAEPPPLPPKKQFSDIVIRPRITPPPLNRYESVSTNKGRSINQDTSVPPIPLPSRRIGRSEGNHPGPGRPRKPGNDDDDYLQPMSGNVPPLLPPPQTRGRVRRQEIYENKTEVESEQQATLNAIVKSETDDRKEVSILPDITLSQLLTLGIDELAVKLNVPTSKLSTMTLVELTTFLSEFIEKSKKPKLSFPVASIAAPEDSPPIFKVNFDQMPDATFVAKFDDNFGEEEPAPFVANFSQFEDAASSMQTKADEAAKAAAVPPADRYAVFREIIDQELQQDSKDLKSSPEGNDEAESFNENVPESIILAQFSDDEKSPTTMRGPKIDTKITEAISHAKDRYAALRDIILVEDLFEKPTLQPTEDLMQEFPEFNDDFNTNIEDLAGEEDQKSPVESSPESNQNEEEEDQTSSKKGSNKFLHTLTVSSTTRDDFEIDELMNRAISNLSLDSREHLSPNNAAAKSPAMVDNNGGSPLTIRRSPLATMSIPATTAASKSQFNDMSTSPIPLQKSPAPVQNSPHSKSPLSKSPIPPQLVAVSNLIDASKRLNSGSLSDVICGSSPDADTGLSDTTATKPITVGKSQKLPKESWAVFDKSADLEGGKIHLKSPKVALNAKDPGESPCSSDGKEEWNRTGGEEYNKRWPKGQTSSSSRDLSPWDDEASEYKKRIPPPALSGADRHGYYMRHARRMNSCDEDYEYEEEINKRRDRKNKPGISRSRENFEFDSPQWYHTGPHHTWSPQDEEGRARSFDRGTYERTTYGPPVYDKREHKIPPSHGNYDRRDYKGYDKRKYYREYMRPSYDFESYGESPDSKDRKISQYYGDEPFEKIKPARRDYENIYEESFGGGVGPRSYKSRDYIYERDRKSFDRDSVESYESGGRRRKSFGSGDVYGSLESREEFRERYMGGPEKTRSLRKGMKMRIPAGGGGVVDDYDQDSETEVQSRRVVPMDTRSLQRPSQGPQRMRKSSGSSPWDGEEGPQSGHGQKGWKRPSSASESERRLAESRIALGNPPSGSDGEKDRRYRKKSRFRSGKEIPPSEIRQSQRYGSHRENYDYINYDDYDQPTDEDKFERLNRRRHEMHQRMMESERRQKTSTSDKYNYEDDDESPRYMAKKESVFYTEKTGTTPQHKHEVFHEPANPKSVKAARGPDFDFDDFEDTPRSNTSSKFNFEEHGFESDFNSPPPASCNSASTTTPATKSSFRFSNDFSDKEKQMAGSLHSVTTFDSEFSPAPPVINNSNSNTATITTQKLRFDDRVTISKFDNDQPSIGSGAGCCDDAFEDDFAKTEFNFEKEDHWNPEPPKKNNLRLNTKLQQRQEMIKKSESINIFAKKNEDPFEDDEFFKSPSPGPNDGKATNSNGINSNGGSGSGGDGSSGVGGGGGGSKESNNFQWESNFAKFDENM